MIDYLGSEMFSLVSQIEVHLARTEYDLLDLVWSIESLFAYFRNQSSESLILSESRHW